MSCSGEIVAENDLLQIKPAVTKKLKKAKYGIADHSTVVSISTIKIDDLADLRLFKEALSSAHSKRLKSAWNAFLSGYKKTTAEKKTYEKILERVAIIEGRGRYATVV